MYSFTLAPFNVYNFAPIAKAFRNVKQDVILSAATFHNDVGFAIEYRKIYCRNFLTLSIQMTCFIRKSITIENLLVQWENPNHCVLLKPAHLLQKKKKKKKKKTIATIACHLSSA